jgi:hypothetical protein
MDHIKILKRAWAILWQYRVLWIFGIILALTTASGSNGSNLNYVFDQNNNNRNSITPPQDIQQQFQELFESLERMPRWQVEGTVVATLISLGIGLACVILLLVVVGIIARNVADAALMRMVNDYEQTGEKKTFREGWRMGWSKAAVRLFLINLTVAIPMIVLVLILISLTLAPLLLWISGNTISGIFGTISTIGMGFLFVLFFIALGVAISIILHFVRRASALEDLGVIEAFKKGFSLVRENLVSIFLMWLIMLGIQLGSVLIVIPIVLISVVFSGVISGLLFLITRGIAGLFLSGAMMWIIAGTVAVPAFILLLIIPLAFIGGLFKVYESTVWTLAYREVATLEVLTEKQDDENPDEEVKTDTVNDLDDQPEVEEEV